MKTFFTWLLISIITVGLLAAPASFAVPNENMPTNHIVKNEDAPCPMHKSASAISDASALYDCCDEGQAHTVHSCDKGCDHCEHVVASSAGLVSTTTVAHARMSSERIPYVTLNYQFYASLQNPPPSRA